MGERPGAAPDVGGLVACLGLVLIAWPRLTGGGAVPFLMTVVAAAAWGVANIVSKTRGPHRHAGLRRLVEPCRADPAARPLALVDGPSRVA